MAWAFTQPEAPDAFGWQAQDQAVGPFGVCSVGADLKMSHRGVNQNLKRVALEKCRYVFDVVSSLAASAAGCDGLTAI